MRQGPPLGDVRREPIAATSLRRGNRRSSVRHSMAMPIFIALHVPAAILMQQISALATAHAMATLLVGLRFAASGSIDRVAYIGAYIAGAEVLWRMTDAGVNWEYGKYAISLIFLVALARSRIRWLPVLPLLYFVLHLPSIALVVGEYDFGGLRRVISSNLSGPFSLTIVACFFARVGITRDELIGLFLTFLAPVLGIFSAAFFGIATADEIAFTTSSNSIMSGGFGPNQVSTSLGMGTLIALLCVLIGGRGQAFGVSMLGLAVLLGVQSALTFSRSGLYCAGLSTFVAIICMVRNPVVLARFVVASVVILTAAHYLIVPAVDEFTGGTITKRFAETDTTNRLDYMKQDLDQWVENPLLGTGPGGSRLAHGGAATHSEVTRLLAEHGALGLLTLLLLGTMEVMNFGRARITVGRGVCGALTSYGLILIASNGWRIVAPSFVLGLCFATFLPDESRDGHR